MVRSTRTGLRNSVLIENNKSVSCHGDDSDHRDEEIIRVLLRSALEAAGYVVTEAANGCQGLELYRYRPYGLGHHRHWGTADLPEAL